MMGTDLFYTFQLPELLYVAFILTLLDMVLAGAVSIYQKRFCSSLGYQGLTRKLAFYLVFVVLYFATRFSQLENWLSTLFFNGLLFSISVYELSSIKRHLQKLNIPRAFLIFIPDDLTIKELMEREKRSEGTDHDGN